MSNQLRLITQVVQDAGAELRSARLEHDEARQRVIRLRGALAMALADEEASGIRVKRAEAEMGWAWPEFRAVVTDAAQRLGVSAEGLVRAAEVSPADPDEGEWEDAE